MGKIPLISGAKEFLLGNPHLPLFIMGYVYSIFWLVLPFFMHNSLFTTDMPGHYFSAWYTKEYVFPQITGWNPYFFFGFPQNFFYQPLFTFSTVLLSFFMPLEYAFKSVVAISILMLPPSFYYFARSFRIGRLESASIMVAMFSLLFIFENGVMGGDMFSTFNVGLVANALGFPLFFFYFGSLNKGFAEGKYLQSTLLLALIILSHTITAIAAVLLLLAFAITHHSRQGIFLAGKQVLLAFLLSAFWLVPAAAYVGHTSLFISGGLPYDLAATIITGAATAYFWLSGKKEFMLPCLFAFIASAFCFVGWNYLDAPMHYYRLTMFLVLMAPIACFALVEKALAGKNEFILPAISCAFFLLVIGTLTGLYPEGSLRKPFAQIPEGIDGRVFIYALNEEQGSNHELQHAMAIRYNVQGVRGLFQESSKNSGIVRAMENQEWGGVKFKTDDSVIREELQVLGINYVVSQKKALPEWKELKKITSFYFWDFDSTEVEKYSYTLFRANDAPLFEALGYSPRHVPEPEWGQEVDAWFGKPGMRENIFFNGDIALGPGSGNEKVELIGKTPAMDRVKLLVHSEKPVPVYVKMSYFPKWKAYQNGAEIPVYKAAPYFMLIYGKGEIELRYEETEVEKIAWLLSILGAAAFIAIMLKK